MARRLEVLSLTRTAILFCASLLVALLAAEGFLRVFQSLRREPFWRASLLVHERSSDPELIYELVPGSTAEHDGASIRINSAGFRDDEFSAEVPAGSRRIVVLGDSVAWGMGVPMNAAFPQALERRLLESADHPYASSIVFNLAVNGYSTKQELRLLETRGLALEPDLVIVSYVLNDPDVADGGLARYYEARFEVVDLLARARRRVQDRLDGIPREYHHRIHARHRAETTEQFRRLGEIRRSQGVPVLVALTPVFRFEEDRPYPWDDLHDFIRLLCADNGLHFLDLRRAFAGHDLRAYGRDAWHPDAEGHRLIAAAIADDLRRLDR